MEVQIRCRQTKDGRDRFQAVLEVCADNERTTVTVGTFDTEREALRHGEREMLKYENAADRRAIIRGHMTLEDWTEGWLASREGKVKENTVIQYRWRMANWVCPDMGDKKLCDLNSVEIRRWLNQTLTGRLLKHRAHDAPLSNKSKRLALETLRACLSAAVAEGLIPENPAMGVTLNVTKAVQKAEEQARVPKHWGHEEAALLLRESGGDVVEALVVLGLLCGLRPGEVYGLKWSDFDWLNGSVWVRRSRIHTTVGQRVTTSPKSGLAREVRLPFEAAKRLSAISERPDADPEWVILSTLSPNNAVWKFRKLCKRVGVTVLPPHSLRHTFASLALSARIPVAAVSEVLGHANATITLKVYAHAMPKDVLDTTGAVERALGVVPPPPPVESAEPDPSDGSGATTATVEPEMN